MALSAEAYAELASEMGLAGTAAASLTEIMGRLASQTEAATAAARANAAAERTAAALGTTAAEVKKATAAANLEAANAALALAKAESAAAAAAAKAADKQLSVAQKVAASKKGAGDVTAQEAVKVAESAAAKARADATAKKAATDAATARVAAAKQAVSAVGKEASAAKSSASAQEALSSALKGLASSSTTASGVLGKVQQVLASLGPKGKIIAVVIGVVAILTAALAGLAKTAITASQAKDQLRRSFGALTGEGDAGGAALIRRLDGLAKALGTTSGQLAPYAKRLLAVRMPAQDLDGALKAITASAALMGEEGAAAASGLYEDLQKLANLRQRVVLSPDMQTRLAQAGVSAKALAKELGVNEDRLRFVAINAKGLGDVMQRILLRQGAGALQAMGRSWDTISSRFREGINEAFAGLSDIVSPFMEELQKLASEFYKGSAGSSILGGGVRGILEPAFKTATAVVRAFHVALLYTEIYALKAYIALRPLWSILSKLELGAKMTWLTMYLLKGTLITLAVVFGVLAVAAVTALAPFFIIVATAFAVGAALQYLYGVLSGAAEHFDDLKSAAGEALSGWAEAGLQAASDLVSGLVGGLSSGASAVAGAMADLAQGALSTFTGVFGIKSPSRVMRKHAKEDIAEEGLGAGLDQGRAKAQASMRALLAPPKGSKGQGVGPAPAGIHIENVNIQYSGSVEDFPKFRELADRYFEELASSGPELEPV